MSEKIDAHHHLWRYKKEDYAWIGAGMEALAKDFLPADLERELAASGIRGSIAVQARQTLQETHWLLQHAGNCQAIQGVVGWAPIAGRELLPVLDRLQGAKKLKGLRHVIQDEPDNEFMARPDFNAGIAHLKKYGLVYDLLIYERHLPAAIAFVNRHPQQVFVLDHIAKPRIREHILHPWQKNIREIARRENVFCKLSGIVTEADWRHWRAEELQPYFEAVLEAFGPKRIMAGSDWPVCLLATTHQAWFSVVDNFIRHLSAAERELILGGVAAEVYSLKRTT